MSRSKFRLRHLAIALALLAAAQVGLSLLLRLHSVHQALRSGLQRAIGRPVEVGRFDLSLWSGARLQAFYITVEEDPEFGAEFLLRADRLDAAPDWRALLRGSLVFSRFWLERPSLNLVRAPTGRWNYEPWAAPRGLLSGGPGARSGAAARLAELNVHEGRVNFKRGPEKLPFALIEVNGSLSAGPDGRWNIDLRAQPFRAGVTLQDAGSLQLQGRLPVSGVTSTPAVPTDFSARWENASLSDALRLIFGREFGVRGRMGASFTLQSALPGKFSPANSGAAAPGPPAAATADVDSAAAWKISGVLRLTEVHRWDLPLAPGLPALNLSVEGAGSADRRRWTLTNIVLEGPRSNLRGRAAIDRDASPRASLRVVTASIRLDDLLAWYRAFHPGVAPDIGLEGYLGADVELEAWPPTVVRAALVTTGARLSLPSRQGGLFLRRAVLEADRSGARLVEASFAAGLEEPGVRVSANLKWASGIPFAARAVGGTEHLAEVSAALAALGLSSPARPVQAAGTVKLRMNWTGFARPWRVITSGSVALENAKFSGGLLRSPITIGNARLDFLPHERRLKIAGITAFDGIWSGTTRAPAIAGPWEFQLAVDRLSPAALVRGFSSEPPDNTSLISRFLPSQGAATVAREAPRWPAWLRGDGTISAGILAVGRLEFERVQGRLSIAERTIALEEAQALLAGGRVRGEARAIFSQEPRYAVRAEFDGVNVAALAALAASSRQCCIGTASGRLELNSSGWNRDALLASLKGAGTVRIRSAALLTLDLTASLARGSTAPGRTLLSDVSGEFSFANGHAWLDRLSLDLPSGQLEATGNLDYRGQLDLRFSARGEESGKLAAADLRAQLKGTLAAPQIVPAPKPSP
jgi:hypothetical protein